MKPSQDLKRDLLSFSAAIPAVAQGARAEHSGAVRKHKNTIRLAGALALVLAAAPALGRPPVLASFGRNGELVCTNLLPGSAASVQWAAAVTGPWTNSPPGLDAVTVDPHGAIRVNVPMSYQAMFYRVRGIANLTYSQTLQEAQSAAQEILSQGVVTSLGVALVTSDRLVWATNFGFADLDTRQPPSATTRFGIGSTSKMFAAAAVMQLVEQKRVELDAPLVRYVPSFRLADPRYTNITVRMLLNHASGLPGSNYRDIFTFQPIPDYADHVFAALAEERLKAAPGYMEVYCNDGFTLVEILVKAVTGQSYAEYVQAAIFDPLGMTHSAFTEVPFLDGTYAKVYRSGVVQPEEFVGAQASGGLYTTPTDLAAFARMFLNRGALGSTQVLAAASVTAMALDQTLGTFNPVKSSGFTYGLGWDTVQEPGLQAVGIEGWSKGGDTGFYGAEMMTAPQAGLAVVVMGTQGAGYNHKAFAQRVLLRALVESGSIAAFPAPLDPAAAPVAPVPDGLLASVAGYYANYSTLYQIRAETDSSLSVLTRGPGGYTPIATGLQYRTDGWFTADTVPLSSYQVVAAAGTQYLAGRMASGPHYLEQFAAAQRVPALAAPLSLAWSNRVGSTWLIVNESPDSENYPPNADPRFTLASVPELSGLVMASPSLGISPQVLDPSTSDTVARMMLVIPGLMGRDLNDLDVVVKGGEEWVRWGDFLHRPAATLPVLPAGTTNSVVIGVEGYSEWRAVQAGAAPVTVSVSGTYAWRFYGPDFTPLASGAATGQATLPAGTGLGYLALFGTAGGSVTVSVH
jgi:CubicO group peptidase (beta-lactamase class C family)